MDPPGFGNRCGGPSSEVELQGEGRDTAGTAGGRVLLPPVCAGGGGCSVQGGQVCTDY